MQKIGPDHCDVLHPDQHVEMQGSALLELEAVEVGKKVAVLWIVSVAEEMLAPTVGIGASEIASSDLFQDVGHVQRLQDG